MNHDESTSENGKGAEKNGRMVLIGISTFGVQGLTVRHKAPLRTPASIRTCSQPLVWSIQLFWAGKSLRNQKLPLVAGRYPLAGGSVTAPQEKSSIPTWMVNAWPIRRIWRMQAVAGKMLYAG